jgi:hypothetical protein
MLWLLSHFSPIFFKMIIMFWEERVRLSICDGNFTVLVAAHEQYRSIRIIGELGGWTILTFLPILMEIPLGLAAVVQHFATPIKGTHILWLNAYKLAADQAKHQGTLRQ